MAGLVGIGLSDLWAASGLEGPEFAGEEVKLFVQNALQNSSLLSARFGSWAAAALPHLKEAHATDHAL